MSILRNGHVALSILGVKGHYIESKLYTTYHSCYEIVINLTESVIIPQMFLTSWTLPWLCPSYQNYRENVASKYGAFIMQYNIDTYITTSPRYPVTI